MARGKKVEIVMITVDGVEVDAKACTKCDKVKPLGEFNKYKASANGRQSYCRECQRIIDRQRSEQRAAALGRKAKRLIKRTTESYKEEARRITGGEYVVMGDYRNNKTGVEMLHTVCGKTYSSRPNDFIDGGYRCTHCYGNAPKGHDKFVEEVRELTGDEYLVIGKYVNSRTHILMKHTACGGYSYPVTPNSFLRGTRCPKCNQSHGERRVRDFLLARNLMFEEQGSYEECKYKRKLLFDFIVNSLVGDIIIEYDGEHHSRPVRFGGVDELTALKRHLQTKRRDRIKTDYCRVNGIPLIRIDYTQFDEIEAILERELTKYGVLSSVTSSLSNDAGERTDNDITDNNVQINIKEAAA